MNNFPNNNPSSSSLDEGKRIRAAIKDGNSWVHDDVSNYEERRAGIITGVENENVKVVAYLKRITEISEELKSLTDTSEIEIRKKLLQALDYQKFVAMKKRNELAKDLNKEDKYELENKLLTDLSLEIV